jgi:hypothetical protein
LQQCRFGLRRENGKPAGSQKEWQDVGTLVHGGMRPSLDPMLGFYRNLQSPIALARRHQLSTQRNALHVLTYIISGKHSQLFLQPLTIP